jgi:hypothetical protein
VPEGPPLRVLSRHADQQGSARSGEEVSGRAASRSPARTCSPPACRNTVRLYAARSMVERAERTRRAFEIAWLSLTSGGCGGGAGGGEVAPACCCPEARGAAACSAQVVAMSSMMMMANDDSCSNERHATTTTMMRRRRRRKKKAHTRGNGVCNTKLLHKKICHHVRVPTVCSMLCLFLCLDEPMPGCASRRPCRPPTLKPRGIRRHFSCITCDTRRLMLKVPPKTWMMY